VVESSAAADAEVLGHRDLDRLDVEAIPDRLQERVREAEEDQVLDRVLGEVMVNPENVPLAEASVKDGIEPSRRGEISAERLLEDETGSRATTRVFELSHNLLEQLGRNGHVVEWCLGGPERRAQ